METTTATQAKAFGAKTSKNRDRMNMAIIQRKNVLFMGVLLLSEIYHYLKNGQILVCGLFKQTNLVDLVEVGLRYLGSNLLLSPH